MSEFILNQNSIQPTQLNILNSLLSSHTREAADEGGEEAEQAGEGHAQEEGHASSAIVLEEVWDDDPCAKEFPIGVLINEQRELLLFSNLDGLLTEPLLL